MYQTDVKEIINIATDLKNKISCGPDGIPTTIMKASIVNIAHPLTAIINNSIQTGCFLDSLKIAKICPIFKTGDKCEISNYRPISLLSCFSKIFEKVVSTRLINYLECHKILTASQYGFRKNLSTYMPLLDMYNKISKACDDNVYSVGIFVDLSKAFDTINHDILLHKLSYYGIRGIALDWFKSYLTNHMQYVSLNDISSPHKAVTCSVPQGSVLGPLLFILYINDIVNCSSVLHFILFADDTNLFYSDPDIVKLQDTVNNELIKLATWFRANRLSLNINKTNFIVFGTKQHSNNIALQIDSTIIQRVNCTKFLGVYVDSKLTWKDHISYIVTKTAKGLGAMNRVRHILSSNTMRMLYYSMIYPYLSYCAIIWGCAGSI